LPSAAESVGAASRARRDRLSDHAALLVDLAEV